MSESEYPPPDHILRALDLRGSRTGPTATGSTPVQPGSEAADGGLRLGVLATLVDVACAGVAISAVQPDWVATSSLVLHRVEPARAGRVSAHCEPLRVGSKSVVLETRLTADDGSDVGLGRLGFSRIPRTATSVTTDIDAPDFAEFAFEGTLRGEVTAECGMRDHGDGHVEMPLDDLVRNSIGTVTGGVQILQAEAAAVSAAGGGSAVGVNFHFLAQADEGPLDARARVVRRDVDGALTTVRIDDRSSGRQLAAAEVLVRS